MISSLIFRQCQPIAAQRAICSGRRTRKRNQPRLLSPAFKRLVGRAFAIVLPPPLDLIAGEFVGGGGDGNGRNPGPWGGSGSGRWGRRGLGLWLAVIAIVIGLSFVIAKEVEINPQWGFLTGLGLGLGLAGDYYWIIGICCIWALVVLGLGMNKEVTSCAGKFLSGTATRRRNRRRFLVFRK